MSAGFFYAFFLVGFLMSIASLLVGPVTGLVDNIIDKIAPDKMSEADREKLKLEARQEAEKRLREREADFYDFVIRYEGQAADMPRVIQILRGLVRPLLTFGLAFLFAYGFVENYESELMDFLFKLNLISLGFWYGEKALTRSGLAQAFKFRRENGGP